MNPVTLAAIADRYRNAPFRLDDIDEEDQPKALMYLAMRSVTDEMQTGAAPPVQKKCSGEHLNGLAAVDQTAFAKSMGHPWPPEDKNAIPVNGCDGCVEDASDREMNWIFDSEAVARTLAQVRVERFRPFGRFYWVGTDINPDLPSE